jgi:hypothetical protein
MPGPNITYTDYGHPVIDYKPLFVESYRGFKIIRTGPHFQYFIEPREGFEVTGRLVGTFTKVPTLKAQIDMWFVENPTAGPDDAFVAKVIRRGRGRPSKATLAHEATLREQQLEKESEITFDNDTQIQYGL